MKCKICGLKAVHELGHFNFAAFFIPLCKEHMLEYQEFKKTFKY
jgi:hypothetical protein